MSATQISFASFAASLLASAQSEIDFEASPCTPPVIDAASAVVAHPLVADGGECIHIDLRRVHVERPALDFMREEFWLDGMHPGWAGVGLDAPSFIPSGSAVVLGLEAGYPFIDSSVSRPGWYA